MVIAHEYSQLSVLIKELVTLIPPEEHLLPNMHTLHLGSQWCGVHGSHEITALLLSPSTITIKFTLSSDPAFPHAQLSEYFETFLKKSADIETMELGYHDIVGRQTSDVLPQRTILTPPVLAQLRNLENLTELHLNPIYCIPEMFDILGGFPRLDTLLMVVDPDDGRFTPYQKVQVGQFPALSHVTIGCELDLLRSIVKCYLSNSSRTGSLVKTMSICDLSQDTSRPDVWNFIGDLSSSLETLEVHTTDIRQYGKAELSYYHLMQMARCRKLVCLRVANHFFHLLTAGQFQAAITGFENLKQLSLFWEPNMSEIRQHLPSTVREIPVADSVGLEPQVLEILAKELPRLEIIRITLSACDTNLLDPKKVNSQFSTLAELVLSSTFLNWKRPGFDTQKMANYIGSIVRPHTRIALQKAWAGPDPVTRGSDWLEYVAAYNRFIHLLGDQVQENMKLRDDLLSW